MSSEVAIILSIILITTSIISLASKTISLSLIMLFYSCIVLNIIFITYGAPIIALVHLTIFAGAVSVMLLATIVITGEADLRIDGKKNYIISAILIIIITSLIGIYISNRISIIENSGPRGELLEFIWNYRPWDLLVMIIILAASMVTVLNLLSRRGEQ